MKMSKEKRALIAGMIGCLLYVIGDFFHRAEKPLFLLVFAVM